ncbi:MAG TPA: hypothetical protein VJN96_19910 [Vicinamibacterales bacterium]|nr:hypothetical protein [Vicinamibacterales bacterium]
MPSLLRTALLATVMIVVGTDRTLTQPAWLGQSIEQSSDVGWLERLVKDRAFGEQECARIEKQFCHLGSTLKFDRASAYARLGAIGTSAAVEAVKRIESAFANRPTIPGKVDLDGYVPYPADSTPDGGWSDLGRVTAADHRTYVLLSLHFYGEWSLFVCWQDGDTQQWTRPYLVPVFVDPRTTASVTDLGGGRFRATFSATPQTELPVPPALDLVIADIVRDTDGDGWTDLEEARLGLNPRRADSDGDGIPDGVDATPMYAAPASAKEEAPTQILRRAIFCAFGLTDASHALFVIRRSPRLQLQSASGPVLYRAPGRAEGGYGILVSWKITQQNATTATVEVYDHEGNMSASTRYVSLKRIGSDWLVVDMSMGSIS